MSRRSPSGLSLGDCVVLACLLEATAPKVGNVHRGADFADMTLNDFLVSSVAIRGVFDRVEQSSVGRTVYDAISATRSLVNVNTNLGLVLLLAPLAKASASGSLREGIAGVLQDLDAADADLVYQAIRLAAPGGLGQADEMDIASAPPPNLLAAMSAAADRDLIARQYVTTFADVFDLVADRLAQITANGHSLTVAIVDTHLRLMSERPDSLIARKCGPAIAQQSAVMAARVLAAGEPDSADYFNALADFDFWLRSDGHRRNPGTSADMLGAGLFVALWEGTIEAPFR